MRRRDVRVSKDIKKKAGATGEFERFRRSGFGQIAEGLFVIKKENKKTFWIGVFIALWFLANGLNNIGNLVTLIKEGRNILTVLNPIAVDAKPVPPDSGEVK